jgi:hypothetical protein
MLLFVNQCSVELLMYKSAIRRGGQAATMFNSSNQMGT